jgi:rhodanese-related sulfurtransferase
MGSLLLSDSSRVREPRKLKTCATCSTKPLKKGIYKAVLQSFVRKNLPKSTKAKHTTEGTYRIEMEGLKPNRTIFYFGAQSRDIRKSIQGRNFAYGKLSNRGVVKSDSKGCATFYLSCPQIYKEPIHQRIYHRHFHFLYYNSKKMRWNTQLYTHQILCDIHQKDVMKYMKDKRVKIVDALPHKYYQEKHIKGALNIPHNQKIVPSKVRKMLGSNKSVPIIVYCYSVKCNAAQKVCKKLEQLGYHNLLHYVDGISKWRGRVEKI